MGDQEFIIRAMPAPGHTRRFRGGRPWGADPVKVKVVDAPAPARIDRDRDGREIITHSNEISPLQLAALQADRCFAVSAVGDGETDASSINALKVRIIDLEKALADERRDHQAALEDLKSHRSADIREAEESAARGKKAEQDLLDAKGQLAEKRNKAPGR